MLDFPSNERVFLREAREGDQKYLLPLLQQSYLALVDDFGEKLRKTMEERYKDMSKVVPDIVTLEKSYCKVRAPRRHDRGEEGRRGEEGERERE